MICWRPAWSRKPHHTPPTGARSKAGAPYGPVIQGQLPTEAWAVFRWAGRSFFGGAPAPPFNPTHPVNLEK